MSFQIPDSAMPHCMRCGATVTSAARTLTEVIGFTAPRGSGGANHVIQRRETGRVVGPCCAEAVKAGANPEHLDNVQGSLL